jgi:hypothetical protein
MAEKNNRLSKDPDLAYAGYALSVKELKRQRMWDRIAMQEMDSKFQAAMMSAITSGAESAPTTPSTCYGTRCPIANYSRP